MSEAFIRNHRLFSCTRKHVYATWQEAEAACAELRESPGYVSRGSPMLAYRCLYGDHWHIGRNSVKTMQRLARVRRLITVDGREQ